MALEKTIRHEQWANAELVTCASDGDQGPIVVWHIVLRFFNVSGMCRPGEHYMLPPLRRLPTVRDLIERKSYFVLHAPRQTGKSTSLRTLATTLTEEGRYASLLLSLEVGAPFPDQIETAEGAILGRWRDVIEDNLPAGLRPPPWPEAAPGSRLSAALRAHEGRPRLQARFRRQSTDK